MKARDDRVDALERENHVRLPIEEEIDFGGASAGDGLHSLQSGYAVDGFFDGAGDRYEHLVDRHYAIVDADDNAGKIGFRKDGNGHSQRTIAADRGEAHN